MIEQILAILSEPIEVKVTRSSGQEVEYYFRPIPRNKRHWLINDGIIETEKLDEMVVKKIRQLNPDMSSCSRRAIRFSEIPSGAKVHDLDA